MAEKSLKDYDFEGFEKVSDERLEWWKENIKKFHDELEQATKESFEKYRKATLKAWELAKRRVIG